MPSSFSRQMSLWSRAATLLWLAAMAGCKNDASPSSKTLEGATAGGKADIATNLSVTRYNPDDFCYYFDEATKQKVLKPECQPPAGSELSYNDGIAVAEGLFGLTCVDNFVDVDLAKIQDVEERDILDAQNWGLKHIQTKLDYLKEAHAQCGDVCVHMRKVGDKDVYSINLPRCTGWQGKIFELSTNQAKGSKKVFAQSACPARHWKNVAKERFGKSSEASKNHCASPDHIDISTKIAGELGVTDATQSQTLASLWIPGTQPPATVDAAGGSPDYPTAVPGSTPQSAPACDDIPPDGKFTCAEQAAYGKCDHDFMQGRCNMSCGRCTAQGAAQPAQEGTAQPAQEGFATPVQQGGFMPPEQDAVEAPSNTDACSDTPPDGEFSCQQQADWGKCDHDFMKDFCHKSCGRC